MHVPCHCHIYRSAEVLNSSLDNGGGNRVSEEQIKNYLQKTLGEEAPQPEWGLPEGWGHYLSGLCWPGCLLDVLCMYIRLDFLRACVHQCICVVGSLVRQSFVQVHALDQLTFVQGLIDLTQITFAQDLIDYPESFAELLCWALDRPVTREQAMTCARRQQGRSWEIVESAVRDLGECLWKRGTYSCRVVT